MIKNLQIYLFVGLLMISIGAFAQIDKGKSRLDIGKTPTTKSNSNQPIQRYQFSKSLPASAVKLDKPAVVNQYFRNALLGTPVKTANSTKKTNNEAAVVSVPQEKSVASTEIPNHDKLYLSDKLTVSNIYPNPANEAAWIDYSISGNVNSASLSFYNLLGSEIASFDLDKSERKLRVSTANWESGVYFYQLNVDGKKLVTKKLLVRHN